MLSFLLPREPALQKHGRRPQGQPAPSGSAAPSRGFRKASGVMSNPSSPARYHTLPSSGKINFNQRGGERKRPPGYEERDYSALKRSC